MLSRREICNVVSVDWESGAEPPYDQAIANARVVALEAIALIRSLKVVHNIFPGLNFLFFSLSRKNLI